MCVADGSEVSGDFDCSQAGHGSCRDAPSIPKDTGIHFTGWEALFYSRWLLFFNSHDARTSSHRFELLSSYQVDIYLHLLQSDGSPLPACINAASLALVDAGIAMKEMVTACSVGFLDGVPALVRGGIFIYEEGHSWGVGSYAMMCLLGWLSSSLPPSRMLITWSSHRVQPICL